MDDAVEPSQVQPTRGHVDQLYDLLDAVGICVAIGLLTLLALGGTSVVREVLTVAFTLFVPGWAVLSNWGILGRRYLALSIVLSVAILALVAMVTLWLHAWHPVDVAEAECGAVVVALSVSLFRRDRSRRRLRDAPSA